MKEFSIISKDKTTHLTINFFSPFNLIVTLFDFSFMIDKEFPAFEFMFTFIFVNIFFRKNKLETLKYFEDLKRETLENHESISIEDIIKNNEGQN